MDLKIEKLTIIIEVLVTKCGHLYIYWDNIFIISFKFLLAITTISFYGIWIDNIKYVYKVYLIIYLLLYCYLESN